MEKQTFGKDCESLRYSKWKCEYHLIHSELSRTCRRFSLQKPIVVVSGSWPNHVDSISFTAHGLHSVWQEIVGKIFVLKADKEMRQIGYGFFRCAQWCETSPMDSWNRLRQVLPLILMICAGLFFIGGLLPTFLGQGPIGIVYALMGAVVALLTKK